MKIKTLVIAPYQGLAEIAASLKPELEDFDMTIIQGDLEEVLPQLQESEAEGFELIVSRGGTARLIRQHSSLPVVEIQVTGFDIMRMLKLVEGYKVPIQMIGFPNIIESVAAVSNLMKVYVPYETVHSEEEAERAIRLAQQNGIMVVVGDAITVRKAQEAGLQGVLITSGREAVLAAFRRGKELVSSISRYKNGYEIYKKVVEDLEQGVGIFNEAGELQEANHSFYKLLKESAAASERTVARRIAYLRHLIGTINGEIFTTELVISLGGAQAFAVNGGQVMVGRERLFYLVLRPEHAKEGDVQIAYSNEFIESFPQLITANADFKEWLQQLQDYRQQSNVIALYGERGSGKRLLIGAANGDEGITVEVDLIKQTEPSVQVLLTLMDHADADTTLCINEIDRLDMQSQRSVVQALHHTRARIVFSFTTDPSILFGKGKLNARLYRTVQDYTIMIPPLRERKDTMEEYIRTFVVKYNERFGKQIVGIRPEVMHALLEHAWEGNLIEMRDTIKLFVRRAKGEYIEEDALSLLGRLGERHASEEGERINIRQPLEDIERDIIQLVLEEEGMSQTKAAKRLGINRTTLWRKLKNDT